MIKFNELQPGDLVIAEHEGQQWMGTVKELDREEKIVCVETQVQDFWFSTDHLYPIPLSDQQMLHLGFQKAEVESGVKYIKDAFRLRIPREGDFSAPEIWYREDRRELMNPISVHQLQNHFYEMTKMELNPA